MNFVKYCFIEIKKINLKLQNFSAKEVNILTYLVLWMACWRCESYAKLSRLFDADTGSRTPVDDR